MSRLQNFEYASSLNSQKWEYSKRYHEISEAQIESQRRFWSLFGDRAQGNTFSRKIHTTNEKKYTHFDSRISRAYILRFQMMISIWWEKIHIYMLKRFSEPCEDIIVHGQRREGGRNHDNMPWTIWSDFPSDGQRNSICKTESLISILLRKT